MVALVIAEHDNAHLKAVTLNTVTAAAQCGGDVHILVAGSGCGAVAEQAAKVAGVSKVLVADAPAFHRSPSLRCHWTLRGKCASERLRRRLSHLYLLSPLPY